MSSSHNREQSSLPNFRHRSLNDVRIFESPNTDATWNSMSSTSSQRSAIQAVQLAKQLQELQVNSDIQMASTYTIHNVGNRAQIQCSENEALAEEELIERLKKIIHIFMIRLSRRYASDTTMQWTVNHGNEIHYTVVISIKQPSNII